MARPSGTASTVKKQQSIAGFFQKRPLQSTTDASSNVDAASSPAPASASNGNGDKENGMSRRSMP